MESIDKRFPTFSLDKILSEKGAINVADWGHFVETKPKVKQQNAIMKWFRQRQKLTMELTSELRISNKTPAHWDELSDRQLMLLSMRQVKSIGQDSVFPIKRLRNLYIAENELKSLFLQAQRDGYVTDLFDWHRKGERKKALQIAIHLSKSRDYKSTMHPASIEHLARVIRLKQILSNYLSQGFQIWPSAKADFSTIEVSPAQFLEVTHNQIAQQNLKLEATFLSLKDTAYGSQKPELLTTSLFNEFIPILVDKAILDYKENLEKHQLKIKINCCPANSLVKTDFDSDNPLEILQRPLVEIKSVFGAYLPNDFDISEVLRPDFTNEWFNKLEHWNELCTRANKRDNSKVNVLELKKMRHFAGELRSAARDEHCGPYEIYVGQLLDEAEKECNTIIQKYISQLRSQVSTQVIEKSNELQSLTRLAMSFSEDEDEMLQNMILIMEAKEKTIPALNDGVIEVVRNYVTVVQQLTFPASEQKQVTELCELLRKLPNILKVQEMEFNKKKKHYITSIESKQERIKMEANSLMEETTKFYNYSNVADTAFYLKTLEEIATRVSKLRNQISKLNKEEKVLQLESSSYPKLNTIHEFVQTIDELYRMTLDFQQASQRFLESSRLEADVEWAKQLTDNYLEMLNHTDRKLTSVKAIQHFVIQGRAQAQNFAQSLPLLRVFVTNSLQQRHWDRMSEIAGFDLSTQMESTMGEFVSLGLESCRRELEVVANDAKIEMTIENGLTEIEKRWSQALFVLESSIFWNVKVVVNLTDIMTVLESEARQLKELAILTTTISTHPPLKEKLSILMDSLHYLKSNVNEWNRLLTQWLLYGNLIAKQDAESILALEKKKFRLVAKYWREIAKSVSLRFTNLFSAIDFAGLIPWLKKCRLHLDDIKTGLHNYIRMKKKVFPRLFLLSDAELLELMTSITNEKFQTMLRTIFPGIKSMKIKNSVISLEDCNGKLISISQEKTMEDDLLAFLTQLQKAIHNEIATKFEFETKHCYLHHDKETVTISTAPSSVPVELELLHQSYRQPVSNPEILKSLIDQLFNGTPLVLNGNTLLDCRQYAYHAAHALYTTVHFVHCTKHTRAPFIQDIVQLCTGTRKMICLEGIDHLSAECINLLSEELKNKRLEYLLMTTVTNKTEKLPDNVKKLSIAVIQHRETITETVDNIEMLNSLFTKLWQEHRCVCLSGSLPVTSVQQNTQSQMIHIDAFTDQQLIGMSNGDFSDSETGILQEELLTANPLCLVDNNGCKWLELLGSALYPCVQSTYLSLPSGSTIYPHNEKRFVICLSGKPEPHQVEMLDGIGAPLVHFEVDRLDSMMQTTAVLPDNLTDLETIERTKDLLVKVVFPVLTSSETSMNSYLVAVCKAVCLEVIDCCSQIELAESTWLDWIVLSPLVGLFSLTGTQAQRSVSASIRTLAKAADCDTLYFPSPLLQSRFCRNQMSWISCSDNMRFKHNLPTEGSLADLSIITWQLDQLLYMALLLLKNNSSLAIVGELATGKSAFSRMLVAKMGEKHEPIFIPSIFADDQIFLQDYFTQLFSSEAQDKKLLLIIDNFRANSCLASALRMLLDCGTIVKNGRSWHVKREFQLLVISSKQNWLAVDKSNLFGFFPSLPLPKPDTSALTTYFEQVLTWHLMLRAFSSEYQSLTPSLATASIQLIQANGEFPLMETIALVKGLMFSWPDTTPDTQSLLRLWVHEILRVLGDKLRTDEQHSNLFEKLRHSLEEHLETNMYNLFKHLDLDQDGTVDEEEISHLIFCEFSAEGRSEGFSYVDVRDKAKLEINMKNFLSEYNEKAFKNNKLNIVVSGYITEHVARVARALRQCNSHVILVGPMGSGRSCCAALAAHLTSSLIFHIDILPGQTVQMWKAQWMEQLKIALTAVAQNNDPVVLMIKIAPGNDVWSDDVYHWVHQPEPLFVCDQNQLDDLRESVIAAERTLIGSNRFPGQKEQRLIEAREDANVNEMIRTRLGEQLHLILLLDSEHYDSNATTLQQFYCDFYQMLDGFEQKEMISAILGSELNSTVNIEQLHNCMWRLLQSTAQTIKLWQPLPWQLYHFAKNFNRIYGSSKLITEKEIKRIENVQSCLAQMESFLKPNVNWKTVHDTVFSTNEELSRNADEVAKQSLLLSHLEKEELDEQDKMSDLQMKIDTLRSQFMNGTTRATEQFQKVHTQLCQLSRQDLKLLAKVKKPSVQVRHAVECIRIVFEDNFVPSKNTLDTWATSDGFLCSPKLLGILRGFDVDAQLQSLHIERLKKYLSDAKFKTDVIVNDSYTASVFCLWTWKLVDYHKCHSLYKPIKDELLILEDQRNRVKSVLEANGEELEISRKLVQSLTHESDRLRTKCETLEMEELLHFRSQVLLDGTEKFRSPLNSAKAELHGHLRCAFGNSLLTSLAITTWGVAKSSERRSLLRHWLLKLKELNIETSAEWFTYSEVAGLDGYTETLSILQQEIKKWPLILDKTNAAQKWLKEQNSQSAMVSIFSPELHKSLKYALRHGNTLIITDVEKDMDSCLMPLINCNFQTDSDGRFLVINDDKLVFNPEFRLYLLSHSDLTAFSSTFISMVHPVYFERSISPVKKPLETVAKVDSRVVDFFQVSDAAVLLQDDSSYNELKSLLSL